MMRHVWVHNEIFLDCKLVKSEHCWEVFLKLILETRDIISLFSEETAGDTSDVLCGALYVMPLLSRGTTELIRYFLNIYLQDHKMMDNLP